MLVKWGPDVARSSVGTVLSVVLTLFSCNFIWLPLISYTLCWPDDVIQNGRWDLAKYRDTSIVNICITISVWSDDAITNNYPIFTGNNGRYCTCCHVIINYYIIAIYGTSLPISIYFPNVFRGIPKWSMLISASGNLVTMTVCWRWKLLRNINYRHFEIPERRKHVQSHYQPQIMKNMAEVVVKLLPLMVPLDPRICATRVITKFISRI